MFIYINTADDDNARILEFFGLTVADCPVVRLITLADEMQKYKPESPELDSKTIGAFVQSFMDGKLKVIILTEFRHPDVDNNIYRIISLLLLI